MREYLFTREARMGVSDPLYSAPIMHFGPGASPPNLVGSPTRIILAGGTLSLAFAENKVQAYGQARDGQFFSIADCVLRFVEYKSRMRYVIESYFKEGAEKFWPTFPASTTVSFKLDRYLREGSPTGPVGLGRVLGSEPCELTISSQELDDFLTVMSLPSVNAISVYLKAAETRDYFLHALNMSVEFLEDSVGGETALIKILTPKYLSKARYKRLGRLANDKTISAGRHAPSGAFRNLDRRNLGNEPVWIEAFLIAREIIDAFIKWQVEGANHT